MIRFNCPTCERPYELPDALVGLPLVCKQCGQRITPPAPSAEPPPPPPAPPPPKPVAAPPIAPAKLQTAAPPPAPEPAPIRLRAVHPPPDDDDVLVAKPDSTPDIDFNIGGPTATSLSDAQRARTSDLTRRAPDLSNAVGPVESVPELNLELLGLPPAPPPKPPKPPAPPTAPPPAPAAEPTVLPFLADLGVFLLLLVAGLLVGELVVRKPMGQVFSEAGSAAKFPPIDLLILLAPPLMFGLIYLLLNSRERTVGAWLRRRRAS